MNFVCTARLAIKMERGIGVVLEVMMMVFKGSNEHNNKKGTRERKQKQQQK